MCLCKRRNPVKNLPFSKQSRCSCLLWKRHGQHGCLQICSSTGAYIGVGSKESVIWVSAGPNYLIKNWVWLQLPICLSFNIKEKPNCHVKPRLKQQCIDPNAMQQKESLLVLHSVSCYPNRAQTHQMLIALFQVLWIQKEENNIQYQLRINSFHLHLKWSGSILRLGNFTHLKVFLFF